MRYATVLPVRRFLLLTPAVSKRSIQTRCSRFTPTSRAPAAHLQLDVHFACCAPVAAHLGPFVIVAAGVVLALLQGKLRRGK